MGDKERFVKALSRFQNFRSHMETRCKILEKAFDEDTIIFDFKGLDVVLDTIIDMSVYLFPKLSEAEIKENIEWYVYEAENMTNPIIEYKGMEYIINSVETLYDILKLFNDESANSR